MRITSAQASIVVLAPATSANLGSGFDAAGLALDWWDTLKVTPGHGSPGDLAVHAKGEEAQSIPVGRDNLLVAAMLRFAKEAGRTLPALSLELELGFPRGRGFGSSAAAIALGLLAARKVLAVDLPDAGVFQLASEIEGHPDNVAPCLFGGATLCWSELGTLRYHPVTVHPDLAAFALIAPEPMGTRAARQILPDTVAFAHAAWTAGRAALLPLALAGAFDLLLPATDDVLHQQRRLASWPEAANALGHLRAQGHAAFVSGAGPSLLVLCERRQLPRVRSAAEESCGAAGGWRLHEVGLAGGGGARIGPTTAN